MKLNDDTLQLHIEALIFASERPINVAEICQMLNQSLSDETETVQVPTEKVENLIAAIRIKYDADHYPFHVTRSGNGYQFLTKKTYHQTVITLNKEKYIKKLSTASMETLSIIAYKQPVTKAEMEYIRGVSCDYAVQKLLEKELIVILGRKEDAIGKPLLYGTSKSFMDYLGINSADELPKLREISALDYIIPTEGKDAVPEDSMSIIIPEELSDVNAQ